MAKRIKLGLVFNYDETWIAGSYYLINLISALLVLEDKNQPEILVYTTRDSDKKMIEAIGYPYLRIKKYVPENNSIERVVNKFSRFLFKKNWIEKRVNNKDLDFIFIQRRSWETDLLSNSKKIFWIPDCQELLLPQLFSEKELNGRKHVYNEMIASKSVIIFSSKNSLNDFNKFYPQSENKKRVINFAVTHPLSTHFDVTEIKKKYNINEAYFFSPNQFWVHKNHQLILDAVKQVIAVRRDFKVVFTGKENDFRTPEYTNQLKKFVLDNQLQQNVLFLGFIDRGEQLCLMKNSIAVIQPSLFEGWSTVVEDAKATGKYLLLSDIPVHREQIQANVSFFNPVNANELSDLMTKYLSNPPAINPIDYSKSIEKFGVDFINVLNINIPNSNHISS